MTAAPGADRELRDEAPWTSCPKVFAPLFPGSSEAPADELEEGMAATVSRLEAAAEA